MVVLETFATMMLKQSDGFRYAVPSGISLSVYLIVLYLFSFVLGVILASLAYAVWTGLGTVLVILLGWVWFGETLTLIKLAAVALIVLGVILINSQNGHSA